MAPSTLNLAGEEGRGDQIESVLQRLSRNSFGYVLEEHASATASNEAVVRLAQLIHHTLGGLSKAQRLEKPANTSSSIIGVFIRIDTALPITLAHWRGYPARLSQA